MRKITKYGTPKYTYFSRYTATAVYFHLEDRKFFLETYKAVTANNDGVIHTLMPGDTLDTLALKYYGSPIYWWIIADINNILDINDIPVGTELRIPQIANVEFV